MHYDYRGGRLGYGLFVYIAFFGDFCVAKKVSETLRPIGYMAS